MKKKNTSLIGSLKGCRSWEDIQERWNKLPPAKRQDLFRGFVQAYLQITPEYTTQLKNVWVADSAPESISARSGVVSHLVAETRDHKIWVIPCKYEALKNKHLNDEEVKDLIDSTGGKHGAISFRLICSNTERLNHRAKANSRVGFCGINIWANLGADDIRQVYDHLRHRDHALVPMKPRPHQVEAVDDGVLYFKKNDRGKYISPCGSGKSLVGYWMAERLGAKTILITVPSLALIRQTLHVWLRESVANNHQVDWICVCSDESVGRHDDVTLLQQDVGIPCLTDPKAIAAFLATPHHGLTIVFSTYQSGPALAKACKSAKVGFDFAVMDEAHKTTGASQKQFSHLLDDRNVPIKKRLFMTATERLYRGKSDSIISMDDSSIYGDTFHLLSFRRAIDIKPPILSDYRILVITVSKQEIADLIKEKADIKISETRMAGSMDAQSFAALIALRKAMLKYPIKHAISFHKSIHDAEVFSKYNTVLFKSKKFGRMDSFHVSGKTPAGVRAKTLRDFETSDCALMTNARCLTEGVDVPNTDAVVFVNDGRSVVDTVQATGRVLRLAPGKKFGYVVLPMVYDENSSNSSGFDSIISTLRALAANDDRVIEYFQKPQPRSSSSSGVFVINGDGQFPNSVKFKDFTTAIRIKCWKKLGNLAWLPFKIAREYARNSKCKCQRDWNEHSKQGLLPPNIPISPCHIYKTSGWVSWYDWLGTKPGSTCLPFEEARTIARSLNCDDGPEYKALFKNKKLPPGLPGYPDSVYKTSGWNGWNDWLGTPPKIWMPFEKARKFARSLNCADGNSYRALFKRKKLPPGLPRYPDAIYKDSGWVDWYDWLGTKPGVDWPPFKEARSIARTLNCASIRDWRRAISKDLIPNNVPRSPQTIYKETGWVSWFDWFGTTPRKTQWLSFRKARAYARGLKLSSSVEWRSLSKLGKLPKNIPSNPNIAYKNSGWVGFYDWLGNTPLICRKCAELRVS